MKVKKLSDVLANITELDVLKYNNKLDVDTYVSTLKINSDGSVCFVLDNYKVVRNVQTIPSRGDMFLLCTSLTS